MIVRPWQPGDTEKIEVQPAQQYVQESLKNVDLQPLSDQGLAMVGEVDGEILIIAGLAPQWENRAMAWTLISKNAGSHFRTIHREVEKFLVRSPFRRIEATVDVGFKEGHRWMKMLDFEPEGVMRAYRPDGGDQVLYARIRRWPS